MLGKATNHKYTRLLGHRLVQRRRELLGIFGYRLVQRRRGLLGMGGSGGT